MKPGIHEETIMPFTNRQRAAARSIVSIFETGKAVGNYSALVVLRDGAGISYGTHQATHGSGTLYKIAKLYCKISRDPEALALQAYLPLLAKTGKNAPSVIKAGQDAKLKEILKAAGKRPQMRYAQERIFELYYMEPAEQFCNEHGFETAMALAIVFDSKIQGAFQIIEPRVRGHLKDEKTWCKAYCQARMKWMQTTKVNPVLKNTVYRPKGFLALIAKDNWELEVPFTARPGSPTVTEEVIKSHLATMEDEDPMIIQRVPETLAAVESESEVVVEETGEVVKTPDEDVEDVPVETKPEEPTAPPIPVVPTPPSIVLPAAEARKPTGWTAWEGTVKSALGAFGLSSISFGAVWSGIASQPMIVKLLLFLGVAGVLAAAIYAVVYMVIRAIHLRAREREAHELNLKQLEIYSDPLKNNVTIETPVPGDTAQPANKRSTFQRIFFKKEG
jgi:hypothetical protein